MALNGLGLGFLFTATDLASGVMQGVGKSFKSLEQGSGKTIDGLDDKIAQLGTGLTATAIGMGGIAASFSLAGKAADFEQALAAVGAVSNATTADLAALERAAMAAGKKTQFSPTEAVLGLNELSQAGYDATESIKLLDPVLALAAGSLGDLSPQEAAGLASQALKAFGIDASLAGRAVDQLLQSANAFAVKPKDLALGLGTVSSGAQTLNQSLTESVITFGLIKNVIPGTERAATAAKVAMERLVKPEVQAALKGHLKELTGMEVAVTDANGGYRKFLDIISDLMPALDTMTESQRGDFLLDIFGTEGLSGVNAMMAQFNSGLKGADGQIRKGGDAIDYLRKQFAGANGVAETFAAKTLDTFSGQQKLLAGSMETLGISVGKPFKDLLRPVVEAMTGMANGAITLLEALGPTASKFLAGLFIGGSALILLAGGALLIQAAAPLIVAGFGMMTASLYGLAASAAAALIPLWPFILAGLTIAGVVAVVAYAIEHNLGGIGDAWNRLTARFNGDGISSTFETIGNYATGLWDALSGGFTTVLDIMSPIFNELGDAFDLLGGAFAEVGKIFGSTTSGPGQGLLTMFRLIGNVLGWVIGIVLTLVAWFVRWVAVMVYVAAIIGQVFKPVLQGIADALSFWIDKIMYVIELAKLTWGSGSDKPTTSGTRGLGGDPAGAPTVAGVAAAADKPHVVTPKPLAPDEAAGAAAAALAAGAAGAIPSGLSGAGGIDYNALAAALAKQPTNVNLMVDGEKLASVVARGQRSAAARAGGRALAEE